MDFAMYYKNSDNNIRDRQQAQKYNTNWKADVAQFGITVGGSLLLLKIYYDKTKSKKEQEKVNQIMDGNDSSIDQTNKSNTENNQIKKNDQVNNNNNNKENNNNSNSLAGEEKKGWAGMSERMKKLDNYIREQEKRKMEEFFGKK